MAITIVQSAKIQVLTGSASCTATLGAAPTAGNQLVVCIGTSNSSATCSMTAQTSQAWTTLIDVSGTREQAMFMSTNPGTGTSVKANFTSGSASMVVFEISGLAGASSTDGSKNAGAVGGEVASGNITTTVASDFLVGWSWVVNSGGTPTWTNPGAPWTLILSAPGGTSSQGPIWVGYQEVSSTGTYGFPGATLSKTTDQNNSMIFALQETVATTVVPVIPTVIQTAVTRASFM